MGIGGAHDFIDQFSLIGHENQSLGVFVQPSDGIHPLRIFYQLYNIHGPVFFRCGADDAFRLIDCQKDGLWLFFLAVCAPYQFSVADYPLSWADLHAW